MDQVSEIPAGMPGVASTTVDVSCLNSGAAALVAAPFFGRACPFCEMARLATIGADHGVKAPAPNLIERIRPLWGARLTNQEIANAVGITVNRLKAVADEHGLKNRKPIKRVKGKFA
jgi:hypothetical protein